jgi:hypothetical protein
MIDWLNEWLGEPETGMVLALVAVLVTFALLWWLS